MRSFYVNPITGDVELDGQNNFRMVEGDEELMQCVTVTLKTNKGEWFLNPEHGFDREVIQVKNHDDAEVQDAVAEAVMQEPRVSAIEELKLDYDRAERHLRASFRFQKENGETVEGVTG